MNIYIILWVWYFVIWLLSIWTKHLLTWPIIKLCLAISLTKICWITEFSFVVNLSDLISRVLILFIILFNKWYIQIPRHFSHRQIIKCFFTIKSLLYFQNVENLKICVLITDTWFYVIYGTGTILNLTTIYHNYLL